MTARTGSAVIKKVTATAPVRICDVGGWTDTWFGAPGVVCSLAAGPGVSVTAELSRPAPPSDLDGATDPRSTPQVRLVAPDIGVDHRFGPDPDQGWDRPSPSVAPLLEHAIADVLSGVLAGTETDPTFDLDAGARTGTEGRVALDPDHLVTVTIGSSVPPGASLGTSASVVVAVIAALRVLFQAPTPGQISERRVEGRVEDHPKGRIVVRPGSHEGGQADGQGVLTDVFRSDLFGSDLFRSDIARAAHRVETVRAGREAGVQDHWAAGLGGALHLAIDAYPDVRVLPLATGGELLDELGDRIVTVALGAHDSSAVHGEVIRAFLTCDGAEHDRVRRASRSLASLAAEAATLLEAGEVGAWADVLTRSTEVQRAMHPGLVGPHHDRAIEVARDLGARGWKVNGAGGDGGSLSVVVRPGEAGRLRYALAAAEPRWRVLDLAPGAAGVTVYEG